MKTALCCAPAAATRATASCLRGPQGLAAAAPLRPRACAAAALQHRRACSSACCAARPAPHHSSTSGGSSSGGQQCCRPLRGLVAAAASQHQQHQHLQEQQLAGGASSIHQQLQQQAAAPTATAAAQAQAAQRALPFAALSRVLLTTSNANAFRSALAQRRQPVSGPFGVLLFLATLLAASFAAIRSVLMRRGKSCRTCRGFGLQRCRLCLGSGRVDWAAKLQHFDVCPLCMNRRFVVCAECGGHYHRAMFAHRRRQAGGQFEPDGSAAGGRGGGADEGAFAGPIVLNLAAAGTASGGVTVVTSGIGPSPGGMASRVLSSMSD